MKAFPTTFPFPLQVIQVIRRELRWTKEDKAELKLLDWLPFPEEMELSAFVAGETLFLVENLSQNLDPTGKKYLVIFQDGIASASEIQLLQANQALDLPPLKLSLEGEKLQLQFHWNYFGVGDPQRDDMKIASLAPGKSLEFKINGKTDFSLTGRRPRHYLEQEFLVLNHGLVDGWQALDSPSVRRKTQADKVVDLRKLLW